MARDFNQLEYVLSKPRFDSYKRQGQSDTEAFHLYLWNTILCEALYTSFQILEVGVRNSMHFQIAKNFNDQDWLKNENSFLHPEEISAVQKTKLSLNKRRINQNEPELVAEMSFGFWTSLLDTRYETLWHKITLGTFPYVPKAHRTRAEISKRMNAARKLRNASFHHHSIWHWSDLKIQHHGIRDLIRWISPSLDEAAYAIDRFPKVFRLGPKECARIAGEAAQFFFCKFVEHLN